MGTKSVAEKLLVKPNGSVWSSDPARLGLVGPLPEGVRVADGPEEGATAIFFADDAASLKRVLDAHRENLVRPAALWVAYPKGNRTDINRDSLWPIVGGYGMRPIGQVALDGVWSALRFRPLAPGEAPFAGGRGR